MSYGENILYFMQKYTYVKIFFYGFLDVTLFLFQTDIVHFHFELKKRLEKMDSLLYYKLYCT